jgi:hypothetical protein
MLFTIIGIPQPFATIATPLPRSVVDWADAKIERPAIWVDRWYEFRVTSGGNGCAKLSTVWGSPFVRILYLSVEKEVEGFPSDGFKNIDGKLFGSRPEFYLGTDVHKGSFWRKGICEINVVWGNGCWGKPMRIGNVDAFSICFPVILKEDSNFPSLQRTTEIVVDRIRIEPQQFYVGAINLMLIDALVFIGRPDNLLGLKPSSQDHPHYSGNAKPERNAAISITPINSSGDTYQKNSDSVGNSEKNVHLFDLHDVIRMELIGIMIGTAVGGFFGFLIGLKGRK